MIQIFTLLLFFLFPLLYAYDGPITLDFEDIHTTPSPISNIYEASYGITFDSNVGAYSHDDYPFSNEPSPQTVIFSLTSPFQLYKPSGFSDSLAFYYSAKNSSPITIYDSNNNILASTTLPPTPNVPNAWQFVSIPFDGVATRVKFQYITLYDNIQLGNIAVPLLSDNLQYLLILLFAVASLQYMYKKHHV